MAKASEEKTITKPADQSERLKALDAALAQIEKQYGKGSVMKMGDQAGLQVETVPTGSLSLDIALGAGGVPKGRIVEIYGPESSGKTTVALHMVAEVQKRGGIAGFIDAQATLIKTSAEANCRQWPITQAPVNGDENMSFDDAVARRKQAYLQRIEWMDAAIANL